MNNFLRAKRLLRNAVPTAMLLIAVMVLVPFSWAGEPVSTDGSPLLILDTDISSDVDDAGAIALLHGLANQGRVRILAMMVSSGDPWSVPCVDAINTWFGRPDIPIGMIKGKSVRHESKYTRIIAEEFPHNSPTGAEAPDAVELYRKILSRQADYSVIIVSVGYLTNLQNLLLSRADAISPLDGMTLVRKKVKKLVCMGGGYPAGYEWNFYQDIPATEHVVRHWPTTIIFSGFEIGKDVWTGAGLKRVSQPNPVRRSYELYNDLTDRPSWDQVTVFYAVITGNDQPTDFWDMVPGQNVILADARNEWRRDVDLRPEHRYLVQRVGSAELAATLEKLMLSTPQ